MKLEKLRKHRKHKRWLEGIFSKNPVFVGGLALPFAVMITSSLKNSVAVSIVLACSLIPTVLLAALLGTKVPRWAGAMIYPMFSMVLVVACTPLILPIAPEVTDSLGVYLPILAVNTLQSTLCARYAQDTDRPGMALVDAITYSIGFALALGVIGVLRELLGNNTVWGVPVAVPFKLGGVQIAFAGFLLLAIFSAFFRFCSRGITWWLYRRDNPKHGTSLPL